MTPNELQEKIEKTLAGSYVHVRDLTGTSDHFQVIVVSQVFDGKSMIDQHRLVKAIVDPDIQSGEVHAFSLKTFTPQQWEKYGKE